MSTADLIAKMLAADKEKGVDGLKLVHKIVSNIIWKASASPGSGSNAVKNTERNCAR